MAKGIGVAGNLVEDIIYPIPRYPQSGELATIGEPIIRSTGGAVCNVIMDLAKLDASLALKAIGVVGEDEGGKLIMDRLAAYPNIDCSQIAFEGRTAFTAVMSDEQTKQRTFFTYPGANDLFSLKHMNWDQLDISLLHVGYILLLGALDQPDPDYGTKMAQLLCQARQQGIETSIDVVSGAGGRFQALVPPALKYTDYCIINELEAEQTTGIPLRAGDALIAANMPEALRMIQDMGVAKWVVVHATEGAFGLDCTSGELVQMGSLVLPKGYIKGTVGAGDAFCAGVLYGAYQGKPLKEAIRYGIASAACSLSAEGSTEGMRPLAQALSLYEEYPLR